MVSKGTSKLLEPMKPKVCTSPDTHIYIYTCISKQLALATSFKRHGRLHPSNSDQEGSARPHPSNSDQRGSVLHSHCIVFSFETFFANPMSCCQSNVIMCLVIINTRRSHLVCPAYILTYILHHKEHNQFSLTLKQQI